MEQMKKRTKFNILAVSVRRKLICNHNCFPIFIVLKQEKEKYRALRMV